MISLITRNFLRVSILSSILTLAACGGGGGGGGGGGVAATGAISGAVSGTTIVAIDENDNIVGIADTAGRAEDVDTDNDLIPDAFSFQLADISLNLGMRVYIISGGVIYPVFFDTDNDGLPDTNVFTLAAETTVDLGFLDVIPFELEGKAISQNDPTTDPDVTANPPVNIMPIVLNSPPTDGLLLSELIDKGINALGDGWVLGARTYFEAAVIVAGNSTSNDADTARFLFALTRFIALGFDTQSDGDTGDMNRLGDILDRLGVLDDEKRANWDLIETPDPLPADSPEGNEYRDFLYNVVRPELIGAVEDFDAISTTFNTIWTGSSGEQLESDYGDVLFLRGLYKAILATIATQSAYNLSADIDNTINNGKTVETFLIDNTDFLGLADTDKLIEAKNHLTMSALDDLDAAIDEISSEVDPQGDDLVTLDDFQDPAKFKTTLSEAKSSILNGANAVGETTLDLQRFFDIGVDFRSPSSLLPSFAGNDVTSLFPDATFDGVVLSPDLNNDVNPADGIPDILQ